MIRIDNNPINLLGLCVFVCPSDDLLASLLAGSSVLKHLDKHI